MISAITAGLPWAIRARMALTKPRAGGHGRRLLFATQQPDAARRSRRFPHACARGFSAGCPVDGSSGNELVAERRQRIELGAGGAAGDDPGGLLHARIKARDKAGNVNRGTGIEHDNIARRAGLIVEHRPDDREAFRRARDTEFLYVATRETELFRLNREHAYPSVLQLGDARRRADGDFIHAVVGVHHQYVLAAKFLQHLGQRFDPLRGKNADHLIRRAGGIGKRPEQVEHRAHAHLAARADGVLHGGVEFRCEQETDAKLVHAPRHLLRRELEADTCRFEHVGAAGLARNRAVAVLRHPPTGRGDHKCRGGRDIKGMHAVAAGAAGIHQMRAADIDARCEFAHHLGGSGDFLHGFALHAQPDEETADLRRRRGAGHDQTHHRAHRVGGKIVPFGDGADGGWHIHG